MKKIVFIFYLCLIFLCGCNTITQIDKLMIVSGISVDYEDDNFEITTQIVNMKNSDQTELSPINLDTKGKTIVESISTLPGMEGQKLYFTHAKVMLVSSKYLMDKGASHLIDLLNYEPRFRSSINLAVTKNKASDVINTAPKTDPIPAFSIADSIKESAKMLRAPDIPYYQFLNDTLESGIDGILPLVDSIDEDKDKKLPNVGGTALFKDAVMVNTLTAYQTKYLLIVRDPKEKSIYSIDNYSFLIEKAKSNMSYNNGEITIKVKMELSLLEGENVENKKLSEIVNQNCKNGIEDVIKITQQSKCDPLGIGRYIKRHHIQTWYKFYPEKWDDFYSSMKINVDVNASIVPSSKVSGDKD